jgi:transglutaminase superfamily protein
MGNTYASPGPMTGDHEGLLAGLPSTVADLAAVGHGLIVHEHLAEAYDVTYTEEDRTAVHLRPVPRLLERILAEYPEPLSSPRPASSRVAGNCRQFTVLMVATLRAHAIPARARCGFGGYFTEGFYEDHWVCEYWTGDEWRLADPQIDAKQREMFNIDLDVLNLPRTEFVVAGDAWQRYRRGEASEDVFGLTVTKESGAWWIAGNLMRDAAALLKIELLPWDAWGAMPTPETSVDGDPAVAGELAYFLDRLAEATLDPAATDVADLMSDPRVHVGSSVLNTARGKEEDLEI